MPTPNHEPDYATKADIEHLRSDMDHLRSDMEQRFNLVDERFRSVDTRFDAVERQLKWSNVLLVVILAAILGGAIFA